MKDCVGNVKVNCVRFTYITYSELSIYNVTRVGECGFYTSNL